MLEVNTTIESLRIYENRIEDEGCMAISRAFRINQSLREVNIRSNRISHFALLHLAKKLHKYSRVERIDVAFNGTIKKRYFPSRVDVVC